MAAGRGLETYSVGYSVHLDGPGFKSRWWTRFSATVQTGYGVHPAFHAMGSGSLPGVKQPSRGFDESLPSSLGNMFCTNVSEEPADFFLALNTERQADSFEMLLLICQTLRRHGLEYRNVILETLIRNQ